MLSCVQLVLLIKYIEDPIEIAAIEAITIMGSTAWASGNMWDKRLAVFCGREPMAASQNDSIFRLG